MKEKKKTNTIFYGCLYNDEMPIYKEKIEEQFKNCAESAKQNNQEIIRWAFDVLVDDLIERSLAQGFVNECAAKYMHDTPNISIN